MAIFQTLTAGMDLAIVCVGLLPGTREPLFRAQLDREFEPGFHFYMHCTHFFADNCDP